MHLPQDSIDSVMAAVESPSPASESFFSIKWKSILKPLSHPNESLHQSNTVELELPQYLQEMLIVKRSFPGFSRPYRYFLRFGEILKTSVGQEDHKLLGQYISTLSTRICTSEQSGDVTGANDIDLIAFTFSQTHIVLEKDELSKEARLIALGVLACLKTYMSEHNKEILGLPTTGILDFRVSLELLFTQGWCIGLISMKHSSSL